MGTFLHILLMEIDRHRILIIEIISLKLLDSPHNNFHTYFILEIESAGVILILIF